MAVPAPARLPGHVPAAAARPGRPGAEAAAVIDAPVRPDLPDGYRKGRVLDLLSFDGHVEGELAGRVRDERY